MIVGERRTDARAPVRLMAELVAHMKIVQVTAIFRLRMHPAHVSATHSACPALYGDAHAAPKASRRDAKRQWQKDAIEESRRQVMERKKALADLEASEAAERFARHTAKVEQMERAEFDKQAAARRRNENTRAAIEQQIAVKAAVREAEREAQLREDAQTRAVLEEDEERFLRVARSVYEEARDDGKNTIPIEKAMFAKSITLMPASTSMRL